MKAAKAMWYVCVNAFPMIADGLLAQCCKRRVLEFDEFLKIEGCKQGKHCFVGKAKDPSVQEAVDCRSDMYQTPSQVCNLLNQGRRSLIRPPVRSSAQYLAKAPTKRNPASLLPNGI